MFDRIFGADISPKIKQKLEYRQALAKSANPGDSLTTIDKKYGNLTSALNNWFNLNKKIKTNETKISNL